MSIDSAFSWRVRSLQDDGLIPIHEYYDRLAPIFDDVYSATGAFSTQHWDGLSQELSEISGVILRQTASTVVDCGCGTGNWSAKLALAAQDVWLVDVSERMLHIAGDRLTRLNPNLRVHKYRTDLLANELAANMPRTADCSLLCFVLSHYTDEECARLIQCATRMSRTLFVVDSRAVNTTISPAFIQKQHYHVDRWIGVRKRYLSTDGWISLLQRSGLTLRSVHVTPHFFSSWATS